jgi:bifunctional UDP-N-acetylglucosamine pyrophosphorylase/glucosamine-1-phosphate N-acetyltransferase
MSTHGRFAAIVPAAGLGTRMKSSLPKFLHALCGQSIITHIVTALENTADEIVLVVGNGRELVEAEINRTCANFIDRISFVEQKELLGSGHAVKTAMPLVGDNVDNVIVVLGDMPLLSESVVSDIMNTFVTSQADVLVSTAQLANPFGYGRIVRNEDGSVISIVEEKDATDDQRKITEANMYPFCFTKDFLDMYLDDIEANNVQAEQYLTDLVSIAETNGRKVSSYTYANPDIAQGANDRAQLSELEFIMRNTINDEHMKNGVTMVDPSSTYIDASVTLEADVTLLPGCILEGTTTIAQGSVVGPNTRIVDSAVGTNCTIESSTIKGSTIDNEVTVGPYVSLRPGTHLHDGSHVGTFVEMKKTEVGKGSKVPHLSYLGDATIGENSNCGAGTITANYDGANKHASHVGDNVKLGVNTVLVAPVEVGDDAYTAAGAVVTKDVPSGALAKGVPAQIVEDWTPPAKDS